MKNLLNQIHHAEFSDLCAQVPDASVDAVITDPPYYNIVSNNWDRQWANHTDYIEWISSTLKHFKRILKPNGSLYIFASHRKQAYIEVEVSKYFRVLNNIVWVSNGATTKRADRDILRSYIPTTEHCVFAEQYHADNDYQGVLIDENSNYWDACQSLKKSIIGDYLQREFDNAGVTRLEIRSLFPSKTGNLTGCVSNWLLGHNVPTQAQYELMRNYLNGLNGSQYLRREYEGLRREYEDLRREFKLPMSDEETNVWNFSPELSGRLHPTQKPLKMIESILRTSTRIGDVVLDCFSGSGTTALACHRTGRNFICGDYHLPYVEIARKRLQDADPYQPTKIDDTHTQLSLFEDSDSE